MTIEEPIVYLLDDDAAVRDSLEALFSSVGLKTRSYSSPEVLLRELTNDSVGCLILDMRLPHMSGLDLQKLLVDRGVLLPILVISGHAEVTSVVRAMRQGAVDFLEKPYNEQILLDRIHASIAMDIERKRKFLHKMELEQRLASLTRREREILHAVVKGDSSKNIARDLRISSKTVDVHRSNILEKLHARSTADLVRMVFEAQDSNADLTF